MDVPWALIAFLAAGAGTLVLGLLLRWLDRKVTARVQWRKGPPIYQTFADVIKLLGKENLMPANARGTGFLLAPVLALAATAVAATLLWTALLSPGTTFLGDLIVVIYFLAIPAIMTIVGGGASGNPHASVGASREIKLLMSYELPLFIVILVAVAHSGWTFQLGGLLAAQQAGAPVVFRLSGVLALVVAIVCMQAKLGQVPFDLAEAECEIMSGVYVEYSGPSLAFWMMTRAMLLAVMPLLLIIVFWGGLTPTVLGVLAFAGKYVLLVALVTLIRNTNPRLRIDQTVRFFWFVLTPLAVVTVLLALIGQGKELPWL
ncbi:MAG: respiratory chain complex I subunit 1 family protein [Planctomycetota bacterium]